MPVKHMELFFCEDIDSDIYNWQRAIEVSSYGVDWKQFLPSSITVNDVRNTPFLRDYLKKEFYESGKVADLQAWLWENVDAIQIEKDLVALIKKPFLSERVSVFITTFHRAPYDVSSNRIFLFDRPQNRKRCVETLYHELMHFLFHWHYWEVCRGMGFSDAEIHDFKESITVLLNPILALRGLPLDGGYLKHKDVRDQWAVLYERNPSFPQFLEKALPIYQRSLPLL
jgi:hypothetical protein